MHASIIQLFEEKVDRNNFISEEDFYDSSFVGVIADYVQDVTDKERENLVKDFLEMCAEKGAEVGDDYVIFTKEFKENHFRHNFNKLKELMEKASLDDFINDRMFAYNLQMYVEDRFDTYIYEGDRGLSYPKSFDSFVREVEVGLKYYVGGVVDYHY